MCYREAAEEGLEAFEREVEAAGRMTEERRQMFRRLEDKQDKGDKEDVEGKGGAAASPTASRGEEHKPQAPRVS